MKRIIAILLLCALPVVLIFTGGCGDIPDTDTEMPKFASDIKEKYGSWEPWNYTPGYPIELDSEEAEKYDFEITMEQSVYNGVPETVTYTVCNKTGETFEHFATFIEKYERPFESYGLEGGGWDIGGWVRVPYYTTPTCGGWTPHSTEQYTRNIHQDLQMDYTYEPGYYRLAIFLPDGTHYAYFEIQ